MAMEDDKLHKEKDIGNNLEAIGNALLSPPSSAEQLLPLLFELEEYLIGVKQSPLDSVQKAMSPAMRALTSQQLLYHVDVDVRVSVASCFIEFMRIPAPDAPYCDEHKKEIFKLIVGAFDKISDISSCSYQRRVRILETFTRIKLWVLMLDLECFSSISQMFKLFLANIREDHPEVIFMCMGFIMIMILEETDEITPQLISPLLDCVRKGNQNVLPIARELGVRVIENCIKKLVPYMNQAVKHTGFPLEDYHKIIEYICDQEPCKVHSPDTGIENCAKSCGLGIRWSGKKKRGKGESNGQNDLNRQHFAKTSLAPDEADHSDGSRIQVVCSKELKLCKGDPVSCDPTKKKQKGGDVNIQKSGGHNSVNVKNKMNINLENENETDKICSMPKESVNGDRKQKEECLKPRTIVLKKLRTPRGRHPGKSCWESRS